MESDTGIRRPFVQCHFPPQDCKQGGDARRAAAAAASSPPDPQGSHRRRPGMAKRVGSAGGRDGMGPEIREVFGGGGGGGTEGRARGANANAGKGGTEKGRDNEDECGGETTGRR